MDKQNNYIQERKAKIKKVSQLEAYLDHGTYEFDKELRVLFKKTESNSPILASSFATQDIDQEFLSGLEEAKLANWQNPLEVKKEKDKLFRGHIIWFCSNGDIKIFSKTESLIICNNEENYVKKVENDAYFSKYFKLPEQTYHNDDTYQIKEKYIDFQRETKPDISNILRTIYDDYRNYFTTMKRESRLTYYSLDELLKSKTAIDLEHFKQVFENINPRLLKMEFPFIRLHGDLWTSNILLEKEKDALPKLWYIDWDESGDYIFFYDFFKFMWNELDVNGRSEYYEGYLKGEFDQHFKQIFSIFQLDFHPEFKKDYFSMFILSFLLSDSGNMPYELKQKEASDFQQKVLAM